MPLFPEHIPEHIRTIIKRFIKDIEKTSPEQNLNILLYGSYARGDFSVDRSNINILVVAPQFSVAWLQLIGNKYPGWRKNGIVAPLMLTEAELKESLEVFPLELLEMNDRHVLLSGQDPFIGCHINLQNLQVQCEQGIWGNLLKLRQQFIEGAGRPEAVQVLLPISLMALVPCLRGILRILDYPSGKTIDETLHQLEHSHNLFSVKTQVLLEVLDMKRGATSPGSKEMPRLFERYLHEIETIVMDLQALKKGGRL